MRPVRPPFLPPYPVPLNGNFLTVPHQSAGSVHHVLPYAARMQFTRGDVSQPASGRVPSKSTTLWIGKIAPTVEADLIRKLLEFCGIVKEWKPATDIKTGAMKGFGFCTFQHPEGVMVALEVLNGLPLDGQALSLKCNSATESYISWYKSSKLEGQSDSLVAISDSIANARQKVDSCLEGRPSVNQGATESSLAASDFLKSLAAETVTQAAPDVKKLERDEDRNVSVVPPKSSARELKREREYLREYRNLLRRWEDHERKLWHSIDIYKEKDRDLRLERKRQIHVDNENVESDDEDEFWNRKYYYKSREAIDRKQRRELEVRQDLLDQEREQKAASYDKDDDNGSRPRLHVEKSDVEKDIDHSVENASLGLDTSNNISNPKLIEPAPHATKRKVSRVAPFADEDNTEKGSASRKFVPISYSAEEMRVGVSESKVQQEIQSSAVEQRKRLIALVPKTKEDIFSYEIKWNLLDEAPDTRLGLSGWINKKIRDLLGTDDQAQGFADYIIGEVCAHCEASQLLDSIIDVLDEDAEPLVLQLYKLIIYQTEELASRGS